jgi:uncharacterized protein (TIGR02996 family)
MSDLAARFSDVVADPDDETAREAFADEVEELDPDRAEFIRLQLKSSRARRAREEGDFTWSTRAAVLSEKHATRWAARIDDAVSGWSFLRGFVEIVRVDTERFLDVADELYSLAPVLHLDLTDAKLVAEDLFQSSQLHRIQSISLFENDFGDAEAKLLAASPYLANLEWLDLAHNQIGEAGLEALAASENLPRLGYLGFGRNAVADPTPAHADEWDKTSDVGQGLQDRYGPREWFDTRPRWRWPPERDALHLMR